MQEDGALGEEELLSFDAYLRETLLRISGAIQVLEELLSEKQSAEKSAAGHDGPQPAAAKQMKLMLIGLTSSQERSNSYALGTHRKRWHQPSQQLLGNH